MKEFITLAKRNSLKKFYSNNLSFSDTSLKGQLIETIEKYKEIYEESVPKPDWDNADDEDYAEKKKEWDLYKKYRQAERRAKNQLRIDKTIVRGNIFYAEYLLNRDEDPDYQLMRGVKTTSDLRKKAKLEGETKTT